MRLEDVPFWQRPIGGMNVIGTDELGNPVYSNALTGATYMMTPPQANALASEPMANDPRGLRVPDGNATPRSGAGASAAPPGWLGGVANALAEGFLAPGMAARGEPVTYGQTFATALDYGLLGAPMSAPEGALRANSFRAYHGSPHSFDQFDLGKIGTGEGAQAYGHGLYFAENEGIARGYRESLTPDFRRVLSYAGPDPAQQAASMLAADIPESSVLDALTDLGATSPQSALDQGRAIVDRAKNAGSMYEVQINADPDTFLDWDAPLSQQPEVVRNALGSNELETAGGVLKRAYNNPLFGGDIARLPNAAPDQVSQALRDQGIPGIRYLDAGSRAAGDGSRNFVVFDDKLITILRKYGIGAAAVGGGWQLSPEEYDAAIAGGT